MRRKNNDTHQKGIGLYSSAVNQAKINGIKGVPQKSFELLSVEEKEKWVTLAKSKNDEVESFYRKNAEQIKFSLLHKIVLLVLEELFNEQPENNPYYWIRGDHSNFEDFGIVYTNYNALANYIWGDNNGFKTVKLKKIIEDLYNADVYLSYTANIVITSSETGKKETIQEYRAERLHLITTIGEKSDKIGNRRCTYVKLNQIFIRNLPKKYIQRRNRLYPKLREYFQNKSKQRNKKNFNVLPSEVTIDMASYLLAKARTKNFCWKLDESTIAEDLRIQDFSQRQIKRGREKLSEALNALKYAGMIKNWLPQNGVNNQTQYVIDLDSEFFGYSEEDKKCLTNAQN